ncbi:MAG: hypothetical protein J1E40_00505 [Oscillospiraceae bacterium]|nr:hypothetical protein [Oscillospiraceae bacterium]
MKLKKIVAGIAAAAVAVSMMAVNAFATTIELDSDYVGAWGAGKTIPKADLEAVGGDVQVTLTVEWRSSIIEDQHIIAPMDFDNGWLRITDQIQGDKVYAKGDGFIGISPNEPTLTFVVSADTIASLGDSGIGFQVQNVIVKSADLEPGTFSGASVNTLEEEQIWDYSNGTFTPDGGSAAPAEDTSEEAAPAPAADAGETTTTTTTAPATGNVPAAVMISVMAVAGVAAVATKKRK